MTSLPPQIQYIHITITSHKNRNRIPHPLQIWLKVQGSGNTSRGDPDGWVGGHAVCTVYFMYAGRESDSWLALFIECMYVQVSFFTASFDHTFSCQIDFPFVTS
jgi:hypothetical protein